MAEFQNTRSLETISCTADILIDEKNHRMPYYSPCRNQQVGEIKFRIMKMLYEGSEIYTIGIMIQDIQTSLRNLRQGFGIRTQKKPRFRCATLFL